LALHERDGSGGRGLPRHVPGLLTAHHEDLTQLAHHGSAASTRRHLRPRAREVVAERGRVVVDLAGERGEREARPRCSWDRALPRREARAGARELQRAETVRAQRLGGAVERGAPILGERGGWSEQNDRWHHGAGLVHDSPPRCWGVPNRNQRDGAGDTPSVAVVSPAPSLTGGEAGAHSARVLPPSTLAPEEVIDVPDHEARGTVRDDPRDSRPL